MPFKDEIKKKLPITELLAGLAEEASELAQAALKYRRALDKKNITPVQEDACYENLLQEIADVKVYLDTLDLNKTYIAEEAEYKKARWLRRLETNDGE